MLGALRLGFDSVSCRADALDQRIGILQLPQVKLLGSLDLEKTPHLVDLDWWGFEV